MPERESTESPQRRHGAVRTCVGCGQRDLQGRMIRFAAGGDGELLVTHGGGPGRSAYLHQTRSCVEALVKSRWLRRSLRVETSGQSRRLFTEHLAMDNPTWTGTATKESEA